LIHHLIHHEPTISFTRLGRSVHGKTKSLLLPLVMAKEKLPEVWLRGPIENIPSLLQPVAHALLQAREEVNELLEEFPNELLWEKPAGAASTGFHLQHLSGVLDRLFTYAQGTQLNEEQFAALKGEGDSGQTKTTTVELVEAFNAHVDKALKSLGKIDERKLSEYRGVGRAQLPSTVMGCLFHSAEHTMRHLGQLIVTVRVVKFVNRQS
jgi:uncharacterized damage-inducible protein DinB